MMVKGRGGNPGSEKGTEASCVDHKDGIQPSPHKGL